jgi:hypothetical protein
MDWGELTRGGGLGSLRSPEYAGGLQQVIRLMKERLDIESHFEGLFVLSFVEQPRYGFSEGRRYANLIDHRCEAEPGSLHRHLSCLLPPGHLLRSGFRDTAIASAGPEGKSNLSNVFAKIGGYGRR